MRKSLYGIGTVLVPRDNETATHLWLQVNTIRVTDTEANYWGDTHMCTRKAGKEETHRAATQDEEAMYHRLAIRAAQRAATQDEEAADSIAAPNTTQQQPQHPMCKCVWSSAEGRLVAEVDFEALEKRVAAYVFNDADCSRLERRLTKRVIEALDKRETAATRAYGKWFAKVMQSYTDVCSVDLDTAQQVWGPLAPATVPKPAPKSESRDLQPPTLDPKNPMYMMPLDKCGKPMGDDYVIEVNGWHYNSEGHLYLEGIAPDGRHREVEARHAIRCSVGIIERYKARRARGTVAVDCELAGMPSCYVTKWPNDSNGSNSLYTIEVTALPNDGQPVPMYIGIDYRGRAVTYPSKEVRHSTASEISWYRKRRADYEAHATTDFDPALLPLPINNKGFTFTLVHSMTLPNDPSPFSRWQRETDDHGKLHPVAPGTHTAKVIEHRNGLIEFSDGRPGKIKAQLTRGAITALFGRHPAQSTVEAVEVFCEAGSVTVRAVTTAGTPQTGRWVRDTTMPTLQRHNTWYATPTPPAGQTQQIFQYRRYSHNTIPEGDMSPQPGKYIGGVASLLNGILSYVDKGPGIVQVQLTHERLKALTAIYQNELQVVVEVHNDKSITVQGVGCKF